MEGEGEGSSVWKSMEEGEGLFAQRPMEEEREGFFA